MGPLAPDTQDLVSTNQCGVNIPVDGAVCQDVNMCTVCSLTAVTETFKSLPQWGWYNIC